MKCTDVKSAIDSASRRNPLDATASAHLSGCPDCHRHSEEANSLRMLLNVQPRVEAPADFDFRLRARIARVEAKPRGRFSFIEGFFGKSFSWAQAGAAMGAVALAVTITSSYFVGGKQPVTTSEIIAKTEAPIATTFAPIAATQIAEVKSNPIRVSVKPVKANAPLAQPVTFAPKAANIAAKEEMTRFYHQEKRQMVSAMSRSTLVGAEDAGLSKPASFVASF